MEKDSRWTLKLEDFSESDTGRAGLYVCGALLHGELGDWCCTVEGGWVGEPFCIGLKVDNDVESLGRWGVDIDCSADFRHCVLFVVLDWVGGDYCGIVLWIWGWIKLLVTCKIVLWWRGVAVEGTGTLYLVNWMQCYWQMHRALLRSCSYDVDEFPNQYSNVVKQKASKTVLPDRFEQPNYDGGFTPFCGCSPNRLSVLTAVVWLITGRRTLCRGDEKTRLARLASLGRFSPATKIFLLLYKAEITFLSQQLWLLLRITPCLRVTIALQK